MQRQRGELVPIGDALSGMGGPVATEPKTQPIAATFVGLAGTVTVSLTKRGAVVGLMIIVVRSLKLTCLVVLFLIAPAYYLEGQEAEWTISNRVDQMSDEVSWYARSPLARSHGIESFISFVCSGKHGEVYIGFDRQVRIRWDEGVLGTKKLRAKWSGRSKPEEAYFVENGRFIHFVKVEETMKHLVEWKRKELKLEVPLVPEGNAIFRYDLSGAARGIAEAREKCRKGEA